MARLPNDTELWRCSHGAFRSRRARQAIRAISSASGNATGQIGCSDGAWRYRQVPGHHFEKLKGGRGDTYSIRINDQWRICFKWPATSPGPEDVTVEDYH
ncbi:MAG TPA: type II toxin-antitoxin system RelE/ParE family toxin [Acetobacteraceae bacterium]